MHTIKLKEIICYHFLHKLFINYHIFHIFIRCFNIVLSLFFQQVQNRVGFPKLPKVSRSCRSLISRILVPQSIRLRINSIRNDAWLETSVVAQTSISGRFFVRIN